MELKNKNILISGGGIAGTTLAFWLKKHGFNPTILEVAPAPREGGFMIDFWGLGFDVAEMMGIMPELKQASHEIKDVVFLGSTGKRVGGFNVGALFSQLDGRMLNILRSSLAHVLYEKTKGNVEYLFGDEIKSMEEGDEGITVAFTHGAPRIFDLVIGADGLHSKVRALTFGDESQFEHYYGYYIASFTLPKYLKEGFASQYLNYTVPNKQVGLYDISEDKMVALFMWRSKEKLSYERHDGVAQKELLRTIFKDEVWECPALLEKMSEANDFYFDAVSQIRMPVWSKGRVVLLGDAGYCPSLLSGQGSALAMVGAYVLAGELKAVQGDYELAFKKYEEHLKRFIEQKQETAHGLAESFVPATTFQVWVRNCFSSLLNNRLVARLFWKKYLTDRLVLKEY